MAMENAADHGRVGFAEDGSWCDVSGGFKRGADGAAIDEDGWLVGGADAIGISGEVRFALRDPPCGATEPGVSEGRIETNNDGIRLGFRAVGHEFKTGLGKLRAHAGCAEGKELFYFWVGFLKKFDGGLGGGV